MERNWTDVGGELVARVGGREAVEAEIGRLDWENVPEHGSLSVGFMQGYAIRELVQELRIPNVQRVATHGGFSIMPSDHELDGFHPGLYGIESQYTNGRARIYVLDTGGVLTPLVSDFWPESDRATVSDLERMAALDHVELGSTIVGAS